MTRFDEINYQLRTLKDAGLEDSPSYQRLLQMSLESAPSSVKSAIMDKAVQEGQLPPPDGYDDAGEPVWMLETIGAFLGLNAEDQRQSIEAFEREYGAFQRVAPATINRVH